MDLREFRGVSILMSRMEEAHGGFYISRTGLPPARVARRQDQAATWTRRPPRGEQRL